MKPSIAAPSDESREREWKKFSKHRRGYLCDVESFNAGYSAAERDTREQCAQLARHKALVGLEYRGSEEFRRGFITAAEELQAEFRAERIRGKGDPHV